MSVESINETVKLGLDDIVIFDNDNNEITLNIRDCSFSREPERDMPLFWNILFTSSLKSPDCSILVERHLTNYEVDEHDGDYQSDSADYSELEIMEISLNDESINNPKNETVINSLILDFFKKITL